MDPVIAAFSDNSTNLFELYRCPHVQCSHVGMSLHSVFLHSLELHCCDGKCDICSVSSNVELYRCTFPGCRCAFLNKEEQRKHVMRCDHQFLSRSDTWSSFDESLFYYKNYYTFSETGKLKSAMKRTIKSIHFREEDLGDLSPIIGSTPCYLNSIFVSIKNFRRIMEKFGVPLV